MDLESQDKREKLFSIELCELETQNISIGCRERTSDENLAHECIISTVSNQHFYGSKPTSILAPNACYSNNYYVEEKVMKEFLKEAAENIENEDSLEENPMNKFNLKYSIYAILLLLLTVFLCWCIKDAIVYTSDLAQKIKNSTDDLTLIEFGLIVCLYFNCALQITTLLIGYYAAKTLKITVFKWHSFMVNSSIKISNKLTLIKNRS